MDLGICMSVGTLAHKLAARDEKNPEQAWNLTRWPQRLSVVGEHRLFVAAGGAWRGYFVTHPRTACRRDQASGATGRAGGPLDVWTPPARSLPDPPSLDDL
jgi:hypothetical protein